MLDARSPLMNVPPVTFHGITLSQAPGYTLTQIAGEDKVLKKAIGKLPATVGKAVLLEGRTVLRIAPKQFWVLGDAPLASVGMYVTPLSSSRTRLLIEGKRAREVLSACALIDFHPIQFRPAQFVLTGIHHTPVLIHCIGDNEFHIYALRTFSLNVWEWLVDVMQGLELPHD